MKKITTNPILAAVLTFIAFGGGYFLVMFIISLITGKPYMEEISGIVGISIFIAVDIFFTILAYLGAKKNKNNNE